MAIEYTKRALWGGAITVKIPSEYRDVSDIRQVPDHQEVWLSSTGTDSLTFDLLERVADGSDKEALLYHFNDIVEAGDTTQILEIVDDATPAGFPTNPPTLHLSALITPPTQPTSTSTSRIINPPTHTIMHLALLRLKEQNTDLLVTSNVPQTSVQKPLDGQADGNAPVLSDEMMGVWREAVRSLVVEDWGLFVT